jgi:hypothetical protein
MKLGQLLVEVPDRRIARFRGHLAAMFGTLEMERALIFRAHCIALLRQAGSGLPRPPRRAARQARKRVKPL